MWEAEQRYAVYLPSTTISGGRLIFHILGVLTELERKLIQYITKAGLKAARKRGRKGWRPRPLDKIRIRLLQIHYDEREHTIGEICGVLKVSKLLLYDFINERNGPDE